jgi:ParB/RepB/Spo0J family partition protein
MEMINKNDIKLVEKEDIEIKMPILVRLDQLKPNPWNPNKVARPEMELLKISIRKSGFCFPLVVMKENEDSYMIVDGFHRHLVAKEFGMEKVPVVVLDESIDEYMNATIRFNRAKGTHQIIDMSKLVLDLVRLGKTDEEIATNLGMDSDEVLRLKQISGLKEAFIGKEFSKSWEEFEHKHFDEETGEWIEESEEKNGSK